MPPDLKAWLLANDLAHFVVTAVERMPLGAFEAPRRMPRQTGAKLLPNRDTVATFRRTNRAAVEAALLHILLLAREAGLLRLGTVPIDRTKIDGNASKLRFVRYDRATELRTNLATAVAARTAKADATDAADQDPQRLPTELTLRDAGDIITSNEPGPILYAHTGFCRIVCSNRSPGHIRE